MKKSLIVATCFAVCLVACGKTDNPLVTASDGQFARFIEPKSALAPACAAAVYEPEFFVKQYNALKFSPEGRITAVSEQQSAECVTELQKRASEVGIAGTVTPEHVRDDRARQRYLALRKK